MLLIQTVIKQWDKSQTDAQAVAARAQIAERHPINFTHIETLAGGDVGLDRHGDDWLGNRIQAVVVGDNLLIDRFCFSINNKALWFKSTLLPDVAAEPILWPERGWLQCQYQWRYRAELNNAVFWLYESVTLNAVYVETLDPAVFHHPPSKQVTLTIS